jgi:hypothetical protein
MSKFSYCHHKIYSKTWYSLCNSVSVHLEILAKNKTFYSNYTHDVVVVLIFNYKNLNKIRTVSFAFSLRFCPFFVQILKISLEKMNIIYLLVGQTEFQSTIKKNKLLCHSIELILKKINISESD